MLRVVDLRTRLQIKPLNVPGLLQHLADPPLPRGTTLGGLAQPQGHLGPVLNGLSTDLLLPRTLKPDMTMMLSDMLQSSLSKFASQFNARSGGQGDSVPTQTVASVPTTDVDVASDREEMPLGPEDQSEGEIVDSEEDPADAGIPRLDYLKMTEEEQQDFDTFSLASVTVPKRPWRAQEDSNVSKPQPQNIRQARPVIPQAVAKAQSIKSAQSDQRSAQGQPVSQAQFPVLVPQCQGPSQGQGRLVITNDPYVLSIVAKGYKLRFTSPPPSPPNPLGDQIPPGARGNSRHAGTSLSCFRRTQ